MSIRIITDTASDLVPNGEHGFTVIPLTVTIDGVAYRDGIDLSKDEFYRRLETSEAMPVSSLVSPHQFIKVFEQVRAAGDEAIVLPISSGLSGTWQSAVTAADGYDCISVIDTQQVSAAQLILAERCMQLVRQGLDRAAIVRTLEEEKRRIVIFAAADTLKYLQKGGRISRGSAIVGGLIGIKPIITLEEGHLVAVGKARGSRQSNSFISRMVEEAGGIDFSMPCATGYSGTDDANLRRYIESNSALLADAPGEIRRVQIGSAVGTHCGPGAVSVAFFAKGKR